MSLSVKVGSNVYKVSKSRAQTWSYFLPALKEQGSKIHELPLSYNEFMAWSNLNVADGLVPYSSVIHAVELLMPYMGKSYGIHANFSLYLDPVYKSRYCSELNALQVQSY